jgi:hypothetical protein
LRARKSVPASSLRAARRLNDRLPLLPFLSSFRCERLSAEGHRKIIRSRARVPEEHPRTQAFSRPSTAGGLVSAPKLAKIRFLVGTVAALHNQESGVRSTEGISQTGPAFFISPNRPLAVGVGPYETATIGRCCLRCRNQNLGCIAIWMKGERRGD